MEKGFRAKESNDPLVGTEISLFFPLFRVACFTHLLPFFFPFFVLYCMISYVLENLELYYYYYYRLLYCATLL